MNDRLSLNLDKNAEKEKNKLRASLGISNCHVGMSWELQAIFLMEKDVHNFQKKFFRFI